MVNLESANTSGGSPTQVDDAHGAWKSNELVLDKIFQFLPFKDLGNVRLTSCVWSQVAGRRLAKKAVVQLTDSTFAGHQVSADFSEAFDNGEPSIWSKDNMWTCVCRQKNKSCKYFSIDHEKFEARVYESELEPKRVVLLGYSAAERLSQFEQFHSIQVLELKVYTQSQASKMLHKVAASAFPNLCSLRFTRIIPEDSDVDENYFCDGYRSKMKEHFPMAFASKSHIGCPLEAVSSHFTLAQGSSGGVFSSLPKSLSTKSLLRELSIEISPQCWDSDWAVLASFANLEVLEILWWQNHPDRSCCYPPITCCYAECLERMLPYLLPISLKRLVLRLNLCWRDISRIQFFLNALMVPKVSLQIINTLAPVIRTREDMFDREIPDGWTLQKEALVGFLTGLVDVVVESLDTLHLYIFHSEQASGFDLLPIFSQLEKQKFFHKSTWSLTIQLRRIKRFSFLCIPSWIRLHKTHNSLTFQVSQGMLSDWYKVYYEFKSLVACISPENEYNYAFHRVGSINDFENLNSSALFRPYFLTAHWLSMQHLVCDQCRHYPRLLSDLPGFREEAKLPRPQHHPAEESVRTWTFCYVPRQILAKWTVQLVEEISAWKEMCKCNCTCWDLVNRFKRIYAFQFTDGDCAGADQDEPESSWCQGTHTFETTLASYDNSQQWISWTRAQIFHMRQLGMELM